MTLSRIAMIAAPVVLMTGTCLFLSGIEHWVASLANEADARTLLGRIGIALPYAIAGGIGVVFLFAANGAVTIRPAGWGVVAGAIG